GCPSSRAAHSYPLPETGRHRESTTWPSMRTTSVRLPRSADGGATPSTHGSPSQGGRAPCSPPSTPYNHRSAIGPSSPRGRPGDRPRPQPTGCARRGGPPSPDCGRSDRWGCGCGSPGDVHPHRRLVTEWLRQRDPPPAPDVARAGGPVVTVRGPSLVHEGVAEALASVPGRHPPGWRVGDGHLRAPLEAPRVPPLVPALLDEALRGVDVRVVGGVDPVVARRCDGPAAEPEEEGEDDDRGEPPSGPSRLQDENREREDHEAHEGRPEPAEALGGQGRDEEEDDAEGDREQEQEHGEPPADPVPRLRCHTTQDTS